MNEDRKTGPKDNADAWFEWAMLDIEDAFEAAMLEAHNRGQEFRKDIESGAADQKHPDNVAKWEALNRMDQYTRERFERAMETVRQIVLGEDRA